MPQVPICVDARMLGRRATGVARFAETLVATLTEVGAAPLLLSDAPTRGEPSRLRRLLAAAFTAERQLAAVPGGFAAPDLFRRAHLAFRMRGRVTELVCPGAPGIMHWTYPVPLRMRGWRNLYTVHDAIPLTDPELTPIPRRRHEKVLREVLHGADRIMTVSEAAREDIVAATGCDPALVVNVGQAVDVLEPLQGSLPAGLERGGYFLFCGAIEPRKNLVRLAEAHRRSGTAIPLVIAGPDGWRSDAVVRALSERERVIRIGYQDRAKLVRLIAGARALLFPSLAEGFGLPIAEAMALGTPVMTSGTGAPAEVAGGAALLVDPLDEEAMAAAIGRLSRDDGLCNSLAAAGRERAKAFGRKDYARRLLALYGGLIHER